MAQRLSQRQLPSFPANCRPKPGAPPSACSPCIKRTVWRVPSSIPGAVRRVLFEHQMTTRLDEHLSARFQACCLNYNDLIKKLFGAAQGIDKHLSFSLQFSSISREQVEALSEASGLPAHIRAFINAFDASLTDEEFNDPRFAYRVLFVPKTGRAQV